MNKVPGYSETVVHRTSTLDGSHLSPYLHPPYASSVKRAPSQALITIPYTDSEERGPVCPILVTKTNASDLTKQHSGSPLGERIIVSGKIIDGDGRPSAGTLVEIWQANAAGRYLHKNDLHDAPLDPNFSGAGYTITDGEGHYRFITIMPGAYPWKNHRNAWRPHHIHFSVFGSSFSSRLVTQMYFPGDPLLYADPVYNCIDNDEVKGRLVSRFDWEETVPETALAYRFDIVLAGRVATPWENH